MIGGYVLSGAKRWIGNGSLADVVIVWARTEDGKVNGFLVEKGTPGYGAEVIEGKGALRAIWQAQISLEDVEVPVENRLPASRSGAWPRAASSATRSRGWRSSITPAKPVRSAPTRATCSAVTGSCSRTT